MLVGGGGVGMEWTVVQIFKGVRYLNGCCIAD